MGSSIHSCAIYAVDGLCARQATPFLASWTNYYLLMNVEDWRVHGTEVTSVR